MPLVGIRFGAIAMFLARPESLLVATLLAGVILFPIALPFAIAMPTRAMLYVITPIPNNPHISAGDRLPGHNLADSMIHPEASTLPGNARMNASQTRMNVSKGNGQP